ncbi:two component sigma-54 specific Fis family transcriptional regulator [Tepidicaulis marinus]|uniref:Two component sigma-54 specific Fis family transcriptional regulator n=1 Tax=Tepidicaulis marinus TaxID=1333998 RepID=A0A081B8W3_9HYPH|nr:sigma-54 dependent transcriptional regulator [Tepidicaulis marinus]GAK44481.1 two component sigma-54 specific Fis family transcriptional regulator [Tepidicaulis marinus]
MASDILIVDDEADIRELISGILADEGYGTRTARCSDSALASIEERVPTLVVLDIWLQGSRLDGLELLGILQERFPNLPVIIISGHGNVETAVSAIKIGAYDYIEKPFKADRLILVVRRAIEAFRLRRENEELKIKAGVDSHMIGSSTAMVQVRQTIEKVAPTGSRVMITGPAGSGKEVAARLLHAQSRRAANPFVVINAASMAPDRVEEELFGTEEGNDGPRKVGVFEQAHGGTLFLDEVADMPVETQGKILRVLVDQTFTRVGGANKVSVDVRVVSSSSKDLRKEIADGHFREDLFHRLNVVPITIPPIAQRRDDIPELVNHFIEQIARSTGLPRRRISDDAMAALQAHDWPGNVRQLRNNIERVMILTSGGPDTLISAEMLPSEVSNSSSVNMNGSGGEHIMAMSLREARETFEREYLMAQISRFGGNISRTAAFIGMERSALHRKLKSLGVSAPARMDMAQ